MLYQIKSFVSFTVVVHYLMNEVHNLVNIRIGNTIYMYMCMYTFFYVPVIQELGSGYHVSDVL